jgi:hypothetical protein
VTGPRIVGIPATRGVKDPQIEAILRALKENVESISSSLFKLPTAAGSYEFYGSGAGSGTGTGGDTGTGGTGGGGGTEPDFTPPPTPTGLLVTGAFSNIILSWTSPTSLYANHAYTQIWRATSNALGAAVMIGFAPGAVYTDPVANNSTYYYWIRFVSKADVGGPYNASPGTVGQTTTDPAYVLAVLSGQITESQLFSSLQSRINLIDGATSLSGSVNARINNEAQLRLAAITSEANARQTKDDDLQTQINTIVATGSGDVQQILAALQTETTARINGDNAEATARETLATQLRGNYLGTDPSALTTGLVYNERQTRITAEGVISSQVTSLSSTVTNNFNTLTASINSEANTRATNDDTIASSVLVVSAVANAKNRTYFQSTAPTAPLVVGDLWYNSADNNKLHRWSGTAWVVTDDTRIAANEAAISAEVTARSNADTAFTQSITTLTSTVNTKARTFSQTTAPPSSGLVDGDLWFDTDDDRKLYRWNGTTWVVSDDARINTNTVAIQTEATTRANADNSLFAQYTVKVDLNGRVSGFGLASTLNNATPFSEFTIIADRFSVVSPTNPGETPTVPFVIGQVNGQQVVAISNALIQDAAITNAKIGLLAVDTAQIANSAIKEAKIDNLAVTEAKIGNLAVGSTKIKDGAITTTKIFAGAVTADKIDASAVTADKISAGAVTASKVSVTDLSSISANLGTITGGSLNIANKFSVDSSGNVQIRNAATGARLEVTNSVINVYDTSGQLRVRMGYLL